MFKDHEFHKWAQDEGVTDEMLCAAASEIESGLIDARLGGFLIKKRVAAPGRGKRGSFRTIVAHRQGERLVFLHGFAKNEKDNISKNERKALLKLGDAYMELSAHVAQQMLMEVRCHEPNP